MTGYRFDPVKFTLDPATYVDPTKPTYYEASADYARWREEIVNGRRKPVRKGEHEQAAKDAELAARSAVERRRTSERIDVDLVKEWVSRIKYKPDTRFTVMSTGYYGFGLGYDYLTHPISLRVERKLPDSTKPMGMREYTDERWFIPVGAAIPVPTRDLERLPADEQFEAFVAWMHRKVVWMEQHEINEWFRVDGRLPYDPHTFAGVEREIEQGRKDDYIRPNRPKESRYP